LKIEQVLARNAQRRFHMRETKQEILTVKEIQDILKIGTNAAYNLIHSKAFRHQDWAVL